MEQKVGSKPHVFFGQPPAWLQYQGLGERKLKERSFFVTGREGCTNSELSQTLQGSKAACGESTGSAGRQTGSNN